MYFDILELANTLRYYYHNNIIIKCSDGFISNSCSGGCKYCFLSKENKNKISKNYHIPRKLKSAEEVLLDAITKMKNGATQYKIVGTEYQISSIEFNLALEAFSLIEKHTNLNTCASFGSLSYEQFTELKDAGVEYYNHNLETARSIYNTLGCKLTYDDKIKTNEIAKRAKLKRCSGIMVGLGEKIEDRIEVAFILRDTLSVESLPFNIFVPLVVAEKPQISTEEIRVTLALFRIIMPKINIIANNGNVYFDGDYNTIIESGANGIGLKENNYLSHARMSAF